MMFGRMAALSLAILTGCWSPAELSGEAAEADCADLAPLPAWHELLPPMPLRVAALGEGEAVLAGEIEAPLTLGGERLASKGGVDLFVSRMDASGKHLWAKVFGGPGREAIASIAARGEAMVLAGVTEGGIDLGGGALGAGAFVAKLDGTGRHVWSKAIAGATVRRVRIDGEGNVAALIVAKGPIDLGDGPVTSPGGTIVAKLGAEGRPVWVKTYGSEVVMRDVAMTSIGDVIAVGSLIRRYDFGGGVVVSQGGRDAILVYYNWGGTLGWTQRYGDSDSQEARVVALNATGRIFALLKEASGPVLAVHAYEGWGEPRWSAELPGPTAFATDGAGNLLYGTTGLTSGDTMLGMLDGRGRLLWERRLAPQNEASIADMTVTTSGVLLVVGRGGAGTDLGGGVILRPAGGAAGFVAAYALRR